MTNLQIGFNNMALGLKETLAPYSSITNGLPNFAANATLLFGFIPQIQSCSKKQKTKKAGVKDDKNEQREELIITTTDNATKLKVYAMFTKNMELQKDAKITLSKLKSLADTEVVVYAQKTYDLIQPNVAKLATYGITAATQTSFATLITNFNASIGKPKAIRISQKQNTKDLADLFAQAEEALANMTAAVEIVHRSQPAFYAIYHDAIKIDVTSNTMALKVTVADSKTKEGIKNVKAEITQKATIVLAKKTSEKGGFTVQNLAKGQYQLSLKKEGYKDLLVPFNISSGEMTKLNLTLDKL